MSFLSRFFGRPSKPRTASKDEVSFDETGVKRIMRDGRTEFISWDELQEVVIITTDRGPWVDDVYYVLSGTDRGCAVPSEAVGMQALVPRLQALPGFKNEAAIQAMGSTRNATFLCWSRENAL